jgi:hypothetical protein
MLTRSRVRRPAAAALAVAAAIFLPAWYSEPGYSRPLTPPGNPGVHDFRPLSFDRGESFINLFPGYKPEVPFHDGSFRPFGGLPETPGFHLPDQVRILQEADGRVAENGEAPLRRSIRTFDEKAVFGAPYFDEILEAAKAHRVDPALIAAVIRAESSFVPSAISRKGAQGLMQLLPAMARHLGVECAFDPRENIRGGTAHLAGLADRFGEADVELILAAYHAGEGAVEEFGGVPPYRETRAYVKRVCAFWQETFAAHPAF